MAIVIAMPDVRRSRRAPTIPGRSALGWFGARWQTAHDDHYRLHDTAWMNPAAGTIMVDID